MTPTSAPTRSGEQRRRSRRALAAVGVVQVLAMATWFSATAVVPALQRSWGLSSTDAAWLAAAVPAGFVVGSLLSASLNLADRLATPRLIAAAALGAGLANLALLAAHGLASALPWRFAVGLFLAGVYPPGMKLVATHYRRGRGAAIGVMVGALTLGSASPHLLRGLGPVSWETVIAATSVAAVAGALLISVVREGPYRAPSPPLDLRYARRALGEPAMRLATAGYLGHRWELYAVWAWLPTFVAVSTARAGAPAGRVTLAVLSFGAIGVAGLLGAVVGGRLADRVGRTALTSGAMILSGACALTSAAVFGAPLGFTVALALIWGAAVIADSAQFSAAATELADPRYAGSMLTVQTALGFLLTIVSIRLVPVVAGLVGWRFALAPLAIGPALGTVAMLRLRTLPQAAEMAGGAR